MGKEIREMNRAELQAAAMKLSVVIFSFAAIGLAMAGYMAYSMLSGSWNAKGPAAPISIMALVISTLPVTLRLGQVKKRLKEMRD